MAIQIPNPGSGNGASGDNEFVLWSKVKDNFNDQTNAASRLLGTGKEQIPLGKDTHVAAYETVNEFINDAAYDCNDIPSGVRVLVGRTVKNIPSDIFGVEEWVIECKGNYKTVNIDKIQIANGYVSGTIVTRTRGGAGWSAWRLLSTNKITYNSLSSGTANAVIDANGELKRSNKTTLSRGDFGLGGDSTHITIAHSDATALVNNLLESGSRFFRNSGTGNPLTLDFGAGIFSKTADTYMGITAGYNSNNIRVFSGIESNIGGTFVRDLLHTKNTSKDSNGFLKAASPIVKVHADKVVLNEEAEQQNVTFKKNGIGDYTITTQSGLSTDGWYLELPKDLNGNPKVAVTLSEVDGVISLKSYKRIFSMETFTFEPDLDNPLDIPDTRWIDLRLNEIPFEIEDIQTEDIQTEDIQTEDMDLDK